MPKRNSNRPLYIKSNKVDLKPEIKLLRIIINARLKFETHIAKAATKEIKAAMTLN